MRKFLLITLPLFLLASMVFAKRLLAEDLNYNMLAGFIRAVPNLIIDNNSQGKACFYGYDQLTVVIDEKYDDVVEIKELSRSKVRNCEVLYVAKDKDRNLKDISKITDPLSIITVGLSDGFVDDGGVILLQVGRRSIELTTNHKKIKAFGVKFDPMLSGLIIN
jgi:hypothetical protein